MEREEELKILNIYEYLCMILKEIVVGGGQKQSGKKEKRKIWIE
ncbi:hypothetical protein VSQ48_01380 [Candidatus Ventrimonas sp. KK005]